MHRCLLGVVLSLLPAVTSAQGIWVEQRQATTGGLEMLVPKFDDRFGIQTAQWNVSIRYLLPGALVVGEVPYATSEPSAGTGSSGIGNLYLGVETIQSENGLFAEFGLRLPTAEDETRWHHAAGMASDPDRVEAFAGPYVPVLMAVNYRVSGGGFGGRLRGGYSLWLPTSDRGGGGSLLYGIVIFGEGKPFAFQGGISGRFLLQESSPSDSRSSSSDRVLGQAVFKVDLVLPGARPGISARFRSGDVFYGDLVEFIAGLHVQVGNF